MVAGKYKGWILTHIPVAYIVLVVGMYPEELRWAFKWSGYAAVVSLAVTLALTPLRLVFPAWRLGMALNHHRRQIGVSVFSYACVHMFSYALMRGSWNALWKAAWHKAYMPVVWVAVPVLFALTLTSNQFSIRRLGYGTWKRLHQNVYWAEGAVILHLWMVRQRELAMVAFGMLAVLQGLRLWRVWQRFTQKPEVTRESEK